MRSKQKMKLRKSTRYIYLLLGFTMLVVFGYRLMKNTSGDGTINTKKEIYSYTNKFNYSYDVKLLENEYISKPSLGMNYVAYVTDLIDNIDLNINYEYSGNKTSKITCKYKVTGKLEGVYTRDGEEQKIWEEQEVLIDENTKDINGNKVIIDQPLNLNLSDKNQLVKNFEQEMGMSITAKYIVTLETNTNTTIEGENINKTEKNSITIDLGRKTTTITGKNNKEDTEYISKDFAQKSGNNKIYICLDVVGLVAAVLVLRYVAKTKSANHITNEYRQEINRILRLCQDKIVRLDNRPNETDKEVVKVKDFGEIVKLSEELFKPILYWEDKETEEAWFIVMSNSVLYHYIIKRGE